MQGHSGHEQEQLFDLFGVRGFAAHPVTRKTGYEGLPAVVEDRISWAAEHSGDPLMMALAVWARTTSMLAVRSGDGPSARDHLVEAGGISEHLGGTTADGGSYQLSFGPSNVAILEVAASVELGDGEGERAAGGVPRGQGAAMGVDRDGHGVATGADHDPLADEVRPLAVDPRNWRSPPAVRWLRFPVGR